MDKSEFLTRILNLYGRFLDNETSSIWIKSCADVLENDINFDDFWWYFCREFDTKTINNIPACQWLYQHSQQFRPQELFEPVDLPKEPPPMEWYKIKRKLEEMTGRKLHIKDMRSTL